jgi:hypothetical protein
MWKKLLAVFLELSILLSILLIAVIHGGAVISFITLLIGAISIPISLYLIYISLDDLADILDAVTVVVIGIVFVIIGIIWAFFIFPPVNSSALSIPWVNNTIIKGGAILNDLNNMSIIANTTDNVVITSIHVVIPSISHAQNQQALSIPQALSIIILYFLLFLIFNFGFIGYGLILGAALIDALLLILIGIIETKKRISTILKNNRSKGEGGDD